METLLGKWRIAFPKGGTALNLMKQSVPCMKVRSSRGQLPFVQNVDAIGVDCVDEAKQVFQDGLEYAQFKLVQDINHQSGVNVKT